MAGNLPDGRTAFQTWMPSCGASTRREIADLHRDLGHTIVYVTHDQTEAMTMGTRVILMREGRIEQDGAPAKLYRQPATTYAAEVRSPGSISCVDAQFSQTAAQAVVTPGRWTLSARSARRPARGVRPDHLEITPTRWGSCFFLPVSRRKDHCFPQARVRRDDGPEPSARTGSTEAAHENEGYTKPWTRSRLANP